MKRIIVVLLCAVCVVGLWAAPPKLECEKVFDRDKYADEISKFVITTSEDNYFRSVTFEDSPKMVELIKSLLEKDRKQAFNVVESYSKGGNQMILNLSNNGYEISIGFTWSDDGDGNLFVSGELGAFK